MERDYHKPWMANKDVREEINEALSTKVAERKERLQSGRTDRSSAQQM